MRLAILLTAMISLTVVANLLMKVGAADQHTALLLRLASWRTALGLGTFGAAALLYSIVLRVLPLNVAQSFAAAQFVAVILASAALLGETIPTHRWIGLTMIAGGIAIVAVTY